MTNEPQPITLVYTNGKRETATRHAIPIEIFWGSTEYHPEPQWLLRAFDLDKQAERMFALVDMLRPDKNLHIERLTKDAESRMESLPESKWDRLFIGYEDIHL